MGGIAFGLSCQVSFTVVSSVPVKTNPVGCTTCALLARFGSLLMDGCKAGAVVLLPFFGPYSCYPFKAEHQIWARPGLGHTLGGVGWPCWSCSCRGEWAIKARLGARFHASCRLHAAVTCAAAVCVLQGWLQPAAAVLLLLHVQGWRPAEGVLPGTYGAAPAVLACCPCPAAAGVQRTSKPAQKTFYSSALFGGPRGAVSPSTAGHSRPGTTVHVGHWATELFGLSMHWQGA